MSRPDTRSIARATCVILAALRAAKFLRVRQALSRGFERELRQWFFVEISAAGGARVVVGVRPRQIVLDALATLKAAGSHELPGVFGKLLREMFNDVGASAAGGAR